MPTPVSKSPIVLVVEDDRLTRILLCELIRRRGSLFLTLGTRVTRTRLENLIFRLEQEAAAGHLEARRNGEGGPQPASTAAQLWSGQRLAAFVRRDRPLGHGCSPGSSFRDVRCVVDRRTSYVLEAGSTSCVRHTQRIRSVDNGFKLQACGFTREIW